MTSPRAPLLAIQVDGIEFALEPGRRYTLGNHAHCDLRLKNAAAPPIAVRIELDGAMAAIRAGSGPPHRLAPGDGIRVADTELRVVVDSGEALILPLPEMRLARDAAAATAAESTVAPPANATATDTAIAIAPVPARSPESPTPESRSTASTFADLMAHELRRASSFSLSFAVHAALLLLLLWLFPPAQTGDSDRAVYGFAGAIGDAEAPQPAAELPAVVAENAAPDEPLAPPTIDRTTEPSTPTEPSAATPAERDDRLLRIGAVTLSGGSAAPLGGAAGDVGKLGGTGAGSGEFRRTVADLRREGLDVVFVLDSTGSMGEHIAATKAHVAAMLEVLRALVPDGRFALVAYRDRGNGERYLVRTLPLGADFYAAVNFVDSIEADGGGDVPEAVRDGLHAALTQPFRPGARRVVVLAGDAPPHGRDLQPLLDEVRRFARTAGSTVHAMVTQTGPADLAAATQSFHRIAEAGNGIATSLDDSDRILQEVLGLVFGQQFQGQLATVQQDLVRQLESPPTWALQLARNGGPELARALARTPVPSQLVAALIKRPRRAVANQLAEMLGDSKTPEPTRQAIAHVLQRTLRLLRAPVDVEEPGPVRPEVVTQLQQRAEALRD